MNIFLFFNKIFFVIFIFGGYFCENKLKEIIIENFFKFIANNMFYIVDVSYAVSKRVFLYIISSWFENLELLVITWTS